ncbi:selenocysteine-specific translation elongation factor [Clostridia bacterium]|nr:selenocysteine-specific translation elongation factor [Clostridia bacterium]
MNYVIVGTAGHVDHGKTELTRALTGVDSDRLKEEKERGISIKLGFAPFMLDNGQKVGLVDVPGHEKFVKQMLAGAAGMDLVLLVIAADEGLMPQTKEHIDILQLLGVEQAIVVISKKDLVEEDWLELVEEDIKEYLADTSYSTAPSIAVSAYTGENIEKLKLLLQEEIEKIDRKSSAGKPKLPIDRVFSIKGFGTVVTGTLWSGQIDQGDQLLIMPKGLKVRARNIQVHGENKDSAYAGQRVAINVTDVEVKDIEHGSILVAEGMLTPSYRLDIELKLLKNQKETAHRTRVHLHVGTAEVLARIYLLDRETLMPGETALVQLQCEVPVVASRGDRVVIRTYSPTVTMGGGEVIDPNPPKHKRFEKEVIESLKLKLEGSPEDLLLQFLTQHSACRLKELENGVSLNNEELKNMIHSLVQEKKIVILSDQYISYEEKCAKTGELNHLLASYQEEYPLRPGISKEEVRSRLFDGYSTKAYNALLAMLMGEGSLSGEENYLHTPEFLPQPNQEERKAIDRLREAFDKGGFLPPDPLELINGKNEKEYYLYLLGQKELIKITEEIVFSAQAYEQAVERIIDFLETHGSLTLADARDLLQSSRKYVLPLLEHLDEKKVTKRIEDKRVLVRK